jgi:hypothetical protein
VISRSSFPRPVPGLVIRYAYLWESEHRDGREEGRKDRPCAIIISLVGGEDESRVVVLPITHTPPLAGSDAIEMPYNTKLRLGMDHERSWIILSEANLFSWPGPDLRPAINGDLSTVVYGLLPDRLFHQIRDRFVSAVRDKRARIVRRSD